MKMKKIVFICVCILNHCSQAQDYNLFLGEGSGEKNTLGYQNTGFGYNALARVTKGQGNTGIGFVAGVSITKGNHNLAVGGNSLWRLQTGSYNVAIGTDTLRAAVDSWANIAIGYDALHDTTGNSNVAVGYLSMMGNTTGLENTAIGLQAGHATAAGGTPNLTGKWNTYLGSEANGTKGNLDNVIVIGRQARVSESNTIVIGNDMHKKTILKGDIMTNGSIMGKRKIVQPDNNSNEIKPEQSGTLFYSKIVNSPTVYYLPKAEIGLEYIFANTNNKVYIQTNDENDNIINYGNKVFTVEPNNSITLVCLDENNWFVTNIVGNWRSEPTPVQLIIFGLEFQNNSVEISFEHESNTMYILEGTSSLGNSIWTLIREWPSVPHGGEHRFVIDIVNQPTFFFRITTIADPRPFVED